ncbi:MAG: NAD(P)H-dependent oxidoreductase [Planctomycetes bacterium]|nr:NAD(P)H-dependent oxidoreductase [Planctomycetota bacterium]
MSNNPRILAFAGSLRKNSFNKRLVRVAGDGASKAGADVTVIDLAMYPLPVFDEDFEKAEGLPDNAIKLKAILKQHDGFLIACPEYNSSITAALKNAIDWASRPVPDEQPLECFKGKVAAIMSASPGGLGGLRGLVHVRAILSNIGVLVLPDQRAISQAHEAFNDDGTLKDPKQQDAIEQIGAKLCQTVASLNKNKAHH